MNLQVLASLRTRFIDRCRGELRALREIRDARRHEADLRPDDILIRTVHGLAGAGATFGFPEVSRQAGDLETLLLESDSLEAHRRALDDLIATLESLTGAGTQPGPSPAP